MEVFIGTNRRKMFMILSGSKLKVEVVVKICLKSMGSKPEEGGAVGKKFE